MTTQEFSTMVQKYQALVYTVCHQLVPDVQEAQVYRAKKMLAQQILQNDRIPCERRSVHGTV